MYRSVMSNRLASRLVAQTDAVKGSSFDQSWKCVGGAWSWGKACQRRSSQPTPRAEVSKQAPP